MIGYIFDPTTRIVATKTENVTKCNDTTILGDGKAVLGTGQYIVTDQIFNVGDILPEGLTDRRSEIPTLSE